MRFLALLYADLDYYAGLSLEDMSKMGPAYTGFYNAFAGHISLSEGVHPAEQATTLTTENGKLVVTDGAPLQGKVEFGGLYFIECRDREDAIAILSKNPSIEYATIELWECTGPLLGPADDRYESEEKLNAYMEKMGVPREDSK